MFFADRLVEFAIRFLLRFLKELRTKSWRRFSAEITFADSSSGLSGLSIVELGYRYEVEGITYEGSDSKPFLNRESRDEYLKDHVAGSRTTVAVNPEHPSVSFLRHPFWIS